jgi:hypothetical protein
VNPITTSTMMVNWVAWRRVGQLTFRSSPIVSLKKRAMKFCFLREAVFATIFLLRIARRRSSVASCCFRQARQESNPQPPVLETGALPIELLALARLFYPYFVSRCSVCVRHRAQYFLSSILPGSFRRFFSVV